MFRFLGDILKEADAVGLFLKDLGVGYFLTLVASIGMIIRAFRTSSGSFTFKELK